MIPESSQDWKPHKVSSPGNADFGDSGPAARTWHLEMLGQGQRSARPTQAKAGASGEVLRAWRVAGG